MTMIKTKVGSINEQDFLAAADKYGVGHAGKSLWRWIENGISPGGFLTAVLRNDLAGAVDKADDRNVELIPNYVRLLYNFAPAGCWGSERQMSDWFETLRLKDREPRKWRVTIGQMTAEYREATIIVEADSEYEAAEAARNMDDYGEVEFPAKPSAVPSPEHTIEAVEEVAA